VTHSFGGNGLEADAASIAGARIIFTNEFDASGFERIDNLNQRIDKTANLAAGHFHSLDGRQRHTGHRRQRPLVDAEQGPRRPQLQRRYHASYLIDDI